MKKRPEDQGLLPGALELMILKTPGRRPMHRYALGQRIEQISDDRLRIEKRSLYPALQRMLKASWLESEIGPSASNRPRRIFKLTQAGRKDREREISSAGPMFAGITPVIALAGQ
jgi:PadR family transcriptional regulator, regulatory protein PadR